MRMCAFSSSAIMPGVAGPWDEKPDRSSWHRIVRRTFNNADLLGLVAHIPQAVNNRPEEMDQLSPKRSSAVLLPSPNNATATDGDELEDSYDGSSNNNNNKSLKAANQAGARATRPRKYSLAEY